MLFANDDVSNGATLYDGTMDLLKSLKGHTSYSCRAVIVHSRYCNLILSLSKFDELRIGSSTQLGFIDCCFNATNAHK